ncbi:type II toxin-antitoxin system Phd/YefM family antitoxin [Demequina pelophila]|uniref:type II toxin-antitoxin system Phd/YefM family antitoxin n=1 Tax=Demequina pelophila TaxID=1638984 RepID=UPI000781F5F3|nr:hypothetical protein [Demequina pelophila]
MAIKTFTARDLNQRSGVVTHAVDEGYEVHITKHGRVVYRILAVAEDPHAASLLDLMESLPDVSDLDVEFERMPGEMRDVDL